MMIGGGSPTPTPGSDKQSRTSPLRRIAAPPLEKIANLILIQVWPELQKSHGYAGITREEGL